MQKVRPLKVKDGDALVLVGTMKGAFLLRSSPARSRWDVAGPYFPGHTVYAMAYDGRGTRHRLWAATSSEHWGAILQWSDDFGAKWTKPDKGTVRFPDGTGSSLKQIWQICPGRADEPNTLYCGVEPAALFVSRDGGASWSLVRGLWDHPHRPRWEPGGGGLCLHTIVLDPVRARRLTVAISTGGVYRSDDGGATWRAMNRGVRAEFLPDKHPEFGQCVHKVVQHASEPDRLFLQNHGGLYRSDDGGESWKDVANGVPSDFGFAMAAHPHDADCVYIVPLESAAFRCTPDARLRVYRTRNAGRSWQPLARGLPQERAYETVLRDALATDALRPAGLYLGTRSGKLYASRDEGASWRLVLEGLPPIVCVKSTVVGARAEVRKRRSLRGQKAARRSQRSQ
jgi:photosystem II stability/assembly factor-like uncharacterized protein